MRRGRDDASAMIYLDYNASTPLRPGVAERLAEALDALGNPSSIHRAGRRARAIVEAARHAVGDSVAMPADAVVFCSGASEANNLAIHAAIAGGCRRLLVAAIEHESVWAAAAGSGAVIDQVPVDGEGRVDLAALEACLGQSPQPALVAVMLANNETGVLQPVADVAMLARRFGARVLCDAVQAAGRLAIDQRRLGVDYLVLSGHKLGGPLGVGALVIAGDSAPAPLIRGGGQERGWRGGTENVPGIAGFAAATTAACDDLGAAAAFARLRERLERGVAAGAGPGRVALYGAAAARLPATSCFGLDGVRADTQVMALDLEGFCVSAGAACSSGKIAPSRVLLAMGAAPEAARSAIRVSFGWATAASDIDAFVVAWNRLCLRWFAEPRQVTGHADGGFEPSRKRLLG